MKYAENEDNNDDVAMNFAMSEIFPINSGCKDAFNQIMAGYMALLSKKIRKQV